MPVKYLDHFNLAPTCWNWIACPGRESLLVTTLFFLRCSTIRAIGGITLKPSTTARYLPHVFRNRSCNCDEGLLYVYLYLLKLFKYRGHFAGLNVVLAFDLRRHLLLLDVLMHFPLYKWKWNGKTRQIFYVSIARAMDTNFCSPFNQRPPRNHRSSGG